MADVKFPITYKSILPGFMDEVLYEMKIIPTNKSFEEIKKSYYIDNSKVNRNNNSYSNDIRMVNN